MTAAAAVVVVVVVLVVMVLETAVFFTPFFSAPAASPFVTLLTSTKADRLPLVTGLTVALVALGPNADVFVREAAFALVKRVVAAPRFSSAFSFVARVLVARR